MQLFRENGIPINFIGTKISPHVASLVVLYYLVYTVSYLGTLSFLVQGLATYLPQFTYCIPPCITRSMLHLCSIDCLGLCEVHGIGFHL